MRTELRKLSFGIICLLSSTFAMAVSAQQPEITSKTVECDGLTYEAVLVPIDYAPLVSYATIVAKTDGTAYTQEEIVVPRFIEVEGENVMVQAIAKDAFKDAVNLKKVDVKTGVINFEPDAFSGCVNLCEVYMASGSSWRESRLYISAFTDCGLLKSLKINNSMLWLIDDHCTGFEGIENIIFEGSINIVSADNGKTRPADYPVKPEMSIEWNDAKIIIESNSMTWFTGEKFTLSEGVKLDNYFGPIGAKYVKNIVVGKMSEGSFAKNYLQNFSTAFSDCDLNSITFEDGTMLAMTSDMVFDTPDAKARITLYVPQDLVNEFRSHPVWGTFGSIVAVSDGVSDVRADAAAGAEYFDLQGRRVDTPQPGSVTVRRHGASVEKVIVR